MMQQNIEFFRQNSVKCGYIDEAGIGVISAQGSMQG